MENTNKYSQEEVEISGTYIYSIPFFPRADGKNEVPYLKDNQGYQIIIDCDEKNRNFEVGAKYSAIGKIVYYETCMCQSKGTLVDQNQWVDMWDKLKEDCESEENQRCKEDTISELYYFRCTEPMKKK